MTPERIAAEAIRLLENEAERAAMRSSLAEIAHSLTSDRDPMEVAADWIERVWSETTCSETRV
jgi:hypothetical protein